MLGRSSGQRSGPRLIRPTVLDNGASNPAAVLEVQQRHSQGRRSENHPVLLEPRRELLVGFEVLPATFDGRADIRRQCIGLVVGPPPGQHEVLRISRVRLALYPLNRTHIMEPAEDFR